MGLNPGCYSVDISTFLFSVPTCRVWQHRIAKDTWEVIYNAYVEVCRKEYQSPGTDHQTSKTVFVMSSIRIMPARKIVEDNVETHRLPPSKSLIFSLVKDGFVNSVSG